MSRQMLQLQKLCRIYNKIITVSYNNTVNVTTFRIDMLREALAKTQLIYAFSGWSPGLKSAGMFPAASFLIF